MKRHLGMGMGMGPTKAVPSLGSSAYDHGDYSAASGGRKSIAKRSTSTSTSTGCAGGDSSSSSSFRRSVAHLLLRSGGGSGGDVNGGGVGGGGGWSESGRFLTRPLLSLSLGGSSSHDRHSDRHSELECITSFGARASRSERDAMRAKESATDTACRCE